ncbi:RNA polymerase sigma factor [Gaoshiqia sediminis]|uniref:RNA polymerase sigma-70 factor n=1 Tax=Gaoshiqia sediminis TaxID=2986998 RepID=A0AA41Y955_9BACT|nr:RNA polymerase sigma-70 factor [Gaoshiqia sediminis]MCW0483881.1 RNA polymerase sigma-70 factor [Gaoshiqia sediminis]
MEKRILVKQLKSDNKHAINELYQLYSSRLYRFAFGYLKSEADTLDIIQEVFIRLWNSRHQLKDDTNLEAFLFAVAKNTIISIFRKKITEIAYLEDLKLLVTQNSSDTESQVEYNLLSEKITQLVSQLPEQRRRIFILSKDKGYTNQAIANELHISIKTVEDHMTKARKFLKENLKEYGFVAILFYEMFLHV